MVNERENYFAKTLKMKEIYEGLGDEESRLVFNARFDWAINRDFDSFTQKICTLAKKWSQPQAFGRTLESFLKKNKSYHTSRKLIIFGGGV